MKYVPSCMTSASVDEDTLFNRFVNTSLENLDEVKNRMDDAQHISANIAKYGITDQLLDLVGGSLEEWQIAITSKEAAIEGLGAKLKEWGKKFIEWIKNIFRKIFSFAKKKEEKHDQLAPVKDKVDKLVLLENKGAEESFNEDVGKAFADSHANGIRLHQKTFGNIPKYIPDLTALVEKQLDAFGRFAANPSPEKMAEAGKATLLYMEEEAAIARKYDFKEEGDIAELADKVNTDDSMTFGQLGYKYSPNYEVISKLYKDAEQYYAKIEAISKKLEKFISDVATFKDKHRSGLIKKWSDEDAKQMMTEFDATTASAKKRLSMLAQLYTEAIKVAGALDLFAWMLARSNKLV